MLQPCSVREMYSAICITELATLKAGSIADIAVFKIREKEVRFYDFTGEYITGDTVLVPQLTKK